MQAKLVHHLRKRYYKCDTQGHLYPVQQKNFCTFCYRHLNYKNIRETPKFDFFEGLVFLKRELGLPGIIWDDLEEALGQAFFDCN